MMMQLPCWAHTRTSVTERDVAIWAIMAGGPGECMLVSRVGMAKTRDAVLDDDRWPSRPFSAHAAGSSHSKKPGDCEQPALTAAEEKRRKQKQKTMWFLRSAAPPLPAEAWRTYCEGLQGNGLEQTVGSSGGSAGNLPPR